MSIGSQLAKKRRELKLSQGALAKKVGVDRFLISRIEKDKAKRPDPEILRKFSEVFSVPISYFYEEGEPVVSQNVKILLGVKNASEAILSRFYSKGKEVILKAKFGKEEIKGKVIECTKSFGEEDK